MHGKLEVQSRPNATAMATTLKVKGLDLAVMLKELGVDDIVQGKLDAELDVKGRVEFDCKVAGREIA